MLTVKQLIQVFEEEFQQTRYSPTFVEIFLELSEDNQEKTLDKLIVKYLATRPEKLSGLMSKLGQFASASLEAKDLEISMGKEGNRRGVYYSQEAVTSEGKKYVAYWIPTMMTMFPKAIKNGHCLAEQEFYNTFTAELKKCPEIADSDWAKSHSHATYLSKLLEFNP